MRVFQPLSDSGYEWVNACDPDDYESLYVSPALPAMAGEEAAPNLSGPKPRWRADRLHESSLPPLRRARQTGTVHQILLSSARPVSIVFSRRPSSSNSFT
jgi:hypothetical protein